MKDGHIVQVKPFISESARVMQEMAEQEQVKYEGSPNRVDLPGQDLFVKNREDVAEKLKLRRKKGYFNEPKDMTKILKSSLQKPNGKQATEAKFFNKNILKVQGSTDQAHDFSEAVKITKPRQKMNTAQYNISEYKMSGMHESTLSSIKPNQDLTSIVDDQNYELNQILKTAGIPGIKKFRAGGVVHTKGKNQANPWFIKSKDSKKLKFIHKKLLIAQKQKEAKEQEDNLSAVSKTDTLTPKKLSLRNVFTSTKKPGQRQLFDAASALSMLPSLQIATVVPSESAPEGIRRYKDKNRVKSQIERNRLRINSPLTVEKSENTKANKVNISLSSRADK